MTDKQAMLELADEIEAALNANLAYHSSGWLDEHRLIISALRSAPGQREPKDGWHKLAADPHASPAPVLGAGAREAVIDECAKVAAKHHETIDDKKPMLRDNCKAFGEEIATAIRALIPPDAQTDTGGTGKAVQIPVDAIVNLVNYQQQCDEDGVMVQVSRQALCEVLAYVTEVRPDNKWASALPSTVTDTAQGQPEITKGVSP